MANQFALHPAYPNPFNVSTQIQFDVPRASLVQIRIYDVQGRVVEDLAARVFDAGTHNVMFDASNRASGMYVVKMTSGAFASSQKLVLIK